MYVPWINGSAVDQNLPSINDGTRTFSGRQPISRKKNKIKMSETYNLYTSMKKKNTLTWLHKYAHTCLHCTHHRRADIFYSAFVTRKINLSMCETVINCYLNICTVYEKVEFSAHFSNRSPFKFYVVYHRNEWRVVFISVNHRKIQLLYHQALRRSMTQRLILMNI